MGISGSRISGPRFSQMSADDFKIQGDELFYLGKVEEALKCYSKAILMNPTDPLNFTNRAIAAFKLKRYQQVEDDCRSALKLNWQWSRAHYIGAQALCELGKMREGIEHLEEAVHLATMQQNQYYIEKFEETLVKWRSKTSSRVSNLAKKEQELQKKIPDYMLCKITLQIIKDPVITPSGITYERQAILQHLEQGGHFDPSTRAPLTAKQLVTNYALKEAIELFLKEN